jgi:uncharacterized repeat protein (TIGR03803 family)
LAPLVPFLSEEGGNYGYGAVFKLASNGSLTLLHNFNTGQHDGQYPYGGLVQDSSGNLYGTTISGGIYNCGVVFKLSASGQETILHNFGAYPGDGMRPTAGLVRDASGNLYGTTNSGGLVGSGTIFKLSSAGKETLLHSFVYADGSGPNGALIRDSAGNLYGTTSNGGSGYGTVFKVTP